MAAQVDQSGRRDQDRIGSRGELLAEDVGERRTGFVICDPGDRPRAAMRVEHLNAAAHDVEDAAVRIGQGQGSVELEGKPGRVGVVWILMKQPEPDEGRWRLPRVGDELKRVDATDGIGIVLRQGRVCRVEVPGQAVPIPPPTTATSICARLQALKQVGIVRGAGSSDVVVADRRAVGIQQDDRRVERAADPLALTSIPTRLGANSGVTSKR